MGGGDLDGKVFSPFLSPSPSPEPLGPPLGWDWGLWLLFCAFQLLPRLAEKPVVFKV